ncbi:mitochondrial sulfite oxidase [Cladorrhinum samala]|uniref:Nitrate reductase [NADPH] n=1 Tax=Cladorrhinum samala TaxID=585594 RepID=A0AAV9HX83_9PEZI|nr:mitochondrial sulfite oxidase [Cladorrhinum samala]
MAARVPGRIADGILRAPPRYANPAAAISRSFRLRARPLSTGTSRPASNKVPSPHNRIARTAPLSFIVGGGVLASYLALSQLGHDEIENQHTEASFSTDGRDPSLPRFRLSEIREHGGSSSEPWVIYEDKVYNIKEWVAAHPGGDVILRAAGGSIEPYWNIFSIHKAPHVREILDQYLIGFIDVADLGTDGRPPAEAVEDPFVADPVRDRRLITHTLKPRNAEPPNEELDRSFRTPNELFYVRHHMWVPVVEEGKVDEYALTVELPDGETRHYTLAELKRRFPTHKVTAVLQCSGNRRNDMTRHAGKTNGLQWGVGAISNAEWEGVRLADVLADAGLKVADRKEELLDPKSLHVQFTGLEAYGASIPLPKAIDENGDVLLAFGMNGKPLPRDHGFPLRAVVPGNVAARSVKWLSKIVISDEESTSQWQRRDYKSFGPNEGPNPDWDRAPSIQEMPVTSAITGVWVGDCVRRGRVPWMGNSSSSSSSSSSRNGHSASASKIIDMAAVPNQKVGFTPKESSSTPCPTSTPADEPIALQGYAYSGGGRAITRVDVSLDGGLTWDQAELVKDCADPSSPCHGNKSWAWTRWRYTGTLPVLSLPSASSPSLPAAVQEDCEEGLFPRQNTLQKKKCTTLIVKATDEAYNTQPESFKGIYNVRGNLATAWHRVKICPKCTTGTGVKGTAQEEAKRGLTWSTGETYGCGFKKEADEVREGMLKSGEGGGESKR